MSDVIRDQLYLAFRLMWSEHSCLPTAPLRLNSDDILVHLDDERSKATLELLEEPGQRRPVLLYNHHRRFRDDAVRLAGIDTATLLDVASATNRVTDVSSR